MKKTTERGIFMSETLKKEAEKFGFEYEKHGRKLVWHDEFDKDTIDFDKWNFRRTMGGADRIYDNSEKHARIEDGKLLMQVHKTDDPEHPYSLSEGFTTSDTMLFTYGYLEIKARPPFRHGAWPSFWMQSATPFRTVPWFSEVDIYEIFSSPNKVVANIHKWGEGKHTSLDGVENANGRAYFYKDFENLNDEYHIYGYEWDEKYMYFYVDGEMYIKFDITDEGCQVPNHVLPGAQCFHDPHFIIFNDEIFTPNGGWVVPDWSLVDEDPIPIDYYIDYVRLYQKEGERLILKDEIAKKTAEAK